MKLIIHTDGGARGNPGPAAIGVVAKDEYGKKLFELSQVIGETTNNVAEYTAVVEALKTIKHNPTRFKNSLEVQFFLDSTLVVHQLNGLFKVKDARLRELLSMVRILEQETGGNVRYSVVPREYNRRADFLVNRALDGSLMSG